MARTSKPLSDIEATAATEVLRQAAYAYLAMREPQGPYVVPLNFVYTADDEGTTGPPEGASREAGALRGRIYFHTGKGRKTTALMADPQVCLAVTVGVAFLRGDSPCADGFSFRSVLVWGPARRLENAAEREAALRAIVAKYDPGAAALPFGKAEFAQTLLYEITIEAASYKQKPRS